eukprot:TRINITY_DN7870_c0_g1_i1.p1 TRINITY_DN7870_c0_g1~~TRINITY_DN7870_c0_g1_i1.p1  ORF type:complete len:227 (+),score=42.65 TRINITY_DN7870_c0_g1_i1:45-725(+)
MLGRIAQSACRRQFPIYRHAAYSSTTPIKRPTPETAKTMPRDFCEMSNDVLLIYVARGDHGACRERLIREIMAVDEVDWDGAQETIESIHRDNAQYNWMAALPYKIDIATALSGGVVSIPLVFHLGTAEWFNERYVTTDVPEPADIETMLEVGAWTWNWMEPVLGQISFLLLTLQFARSQLQNLGAKPYTAWLHSRRAERLIKLYPRYHPRIVSDFAKSETLIDNK